MREKPFAICVTLMMPEADSADSSATTQSVTAACKHPPGNAE